MSPLLLSLTGNPASRLGFAHPLVITLIGVAVLLAATVEAAPKLYTRNSTWLEASTDCQEIAHVLSHGFTEEDLQAMAQQMLAQKVTRAWVGGMRDACPALSGNLPTSGQRPRGSNGVGTNGAGIWTWVDNTTFYVERQRACFGNSYCRWAPNEPRNGNDFLFLEFSNGIWSTNPTAFRDIFWRSGNRSTQLAYFCNSPSESRPTNTQLGMAEVSVTPVSVVGNGQSYVVLRAQIPRFPNGPNQPPSTNAFMWRAAVDACHALSRTGKYARQPSVEQAAVPVVRLAGVRSFQENAALTQLLAEHNIQEVLLGGFDARDGVWRWMSGDTFAHASVCAQPFCGWATKTIPSVVNATASSFLKELNGGVSRGTARFVLAQRNPATNELVWRAVYASDSMDLIGQGLSVVCEVVPTVTLPIVYTLPSRRLGAPVVVENAIAVATTYSEAVEHCAKLEAGLVTPRNAVLADMYRRLEPSGSRLFWLGARSVVVSKRQSVWQGQWEWESGEPFWTSDGRCIGDYCPWVPLNSGALVDDVTPNRVLRSDPALASFSNDASTPGRDAAVLCALPLSSRAATNPFGVAEPAWIPTMSLVTGTGESKVYYLFPQPVSWEAAQDMCERKVTDGSRARLSTISSPLERRTLEYMMVQAGVEHAWLGAFSPASVAGAPVGDWRWITGRSFLGARNGTCLQAFCPDVDTVALEQRNGVVEAYLTLTVRHEAASSRTAFTMTPASSGQAKLPVLCEITRSGATMGAAHDGQFDGLRLFSIHTAAKTWSEADSSCARDNGVLVGLRSAFETDLLATLAASNGVTDLWSGGYSSGGVWYWKRFASEIPAAFADVFDNGTACRVGVYCPWDVTNPLAGTLVSDVDSNATSRAAFNVATGRWFAASSSERRPYVCRFTPLARNSSLLPPPRAQAHLLYPEARRWRSSAHACDASRVGLSPGVLSAVKSEIDFITLRNLLEYTAVQSVHVGASDLVSEGQWRWVDGNELFYVGTACVVNKYCKWGAKQPDDHRYYGAHGEHMAQLLISDSAGGMFDIGDIGQARVCTYYSGVHTSASVIPPEATGAGSPSAPTTSSGRQSLQVFATFPVMKSLSGARSVCEKRALRPVQQFSTAHLPVIAGDQAQDVLTTALRGRGFGSGTWLDLVFRTDAWEWETSRVKVASRTWETSPYRCSYGEFCQWEKLTSMNDTNISQGVHLRVQLLPNDVGEYPFWFFSGPEDARWVTCELDTKPEPVSASSTALAVDINDVEVSQRVYLRDPAKGTLSPGSRMVAEGAERRCTSLSLGGRRGRLIENQQDAYVEVLSAAVGRDSTSASRQGNWFIGAGWRINERELAKGNGSNSAAVYDFHWLSSGLRSRSSRFLWARAPVVASYGNPFLPPPNASANGTGTGRSGTENTPLSLYMLGADTNGSVQWVFQGYGATAGNTSRVLCEVTDSSVVSMYTATGVSPMRVVYATSSGESTLDDVYQRCAARRPGVSSLFAADQVGDVAHVAAISANGSLALAFRPQFVTRAFLDIGRGNQATRLSDRWNVRELRYAPPSNTSTPVMPPFYRHEKSSPQFGRCRTRMCWLTSAYDAVPLDSSTLQSQLHGSPLVLSAAGWEVAPQPHGTGESGSLCEVARVRAPPRATAVVETTTDISTAKFGHLYVISTSPVGSVHQADRACASLGLAHTSMRTTVVAQGVASVPAGRTRFAVDDLVLLFHGGGGSNASGTSTASAAAATNAMAGGSGVFFYSADSNGNAAAAKAAAPPVFSPMPLLCQFVVETPVDQPRTTGPTTGGTYWLLPDCAADWAMAQQACGEINAVVAEAPTTRNSTEFVLAQQLLWIHGLTTAFAATPGDLSRGTLISMTRHNRSVQLVEPGADLPDFATAQYYYAVLCWQPAEAGIGTVPLTTIRGSAASSTTQAATYPEHFVAAPIAAPASWWSPADADKYRNLVYLAIPDLGGTLSVREFTAKLSFDQSDDDVLAYLPSTTDIAIGSHLVGQSAAWETGAFTAATSMNGGQNWTWSPRRSASIDLNESPLPRGRSFPSTGSTFYHIVGNKASCPQAWSATACNTITDSTGREITGLGFWNRLSDAAAFVPTRAVLPFNLRTGPGLVRVNDTFQARGSLVMPRFLTRLPIEAASFSTRLLEDLLATDSGFFGAGNVPAVNKSEGSPPVRRLVLAVPSDLVTRTNGDSVCSTTHVAGFPGRLASITNAREQVAAVDLLRRRNVPRAWIAATIIRGRWAWPTGSRCDPSVPEGQNSKNATHCDLMLQAVNQAPPTFGNNAGLFAAINWNGTLDIVGETGATPAEAVAGVPQFNGILVLCEFDVLGPSPLVTEVSASSPESVVCSDVDACSGFGQAVLGPLGCLCVCNDLKGGVACNRPVAVLDSATQLAIRVPISVAADANAIDTIQKKVQERLYNGAPTVSIAVSRFKCNAPQAFLTASFPRLSRAVNVEALMTPFRDINVIAAMQEDLRTSHAIEASLISIAEGDLPSQRSRCNLSLDDRHLPDVNKWTCETAPINQVGRLVRAVMYIPCARLDGNTRYEPCVSVTEVLRSGDNSWVCRHAVRCEVLLAPDDRDVATFRLNSVVTGLASPMQFPSLVSRSDGRTVFVDLFFFSSSPPGARLAINTVITVVEQLSAGRIFGIVAVILTSVAGLFWFIAALLVCLSSGQVGFPLCKATSILVIIGIPVTVVLLLSRSSYTASFDVTFSEYRTDQCDTSPVSAVSHRFIRVEAHGQCVEPEILGEPEGPLVISASCSAKHDKKIRVRYGTRITECESAVVKVFDEGFCLKESDVFPGRPPRLSQYIQMYCDSKTSADDRKKEFRAVMTGTVFNVTDEKVIPKDTDTVVAAPHRAGSQVQTYMDTIKLPVAPYVINEGASAYVAFANDSSLLSEVNQSARLERVLFEGEGPSLSASVSSLGVLFNDYDTSSAVNGPASLRGAMRLNNIADSDFDIARFEEYTIHFWMRASSSTRGFVFVMSDNWVRKDTGQSQLVEQAFNRIDNRGIGKWRNEWNVYAAVYADGAAKTIRFVSWTPKENQDMVWRLPRLFDDTWHFVAIGFSHYGERVYAQVFVDGETSSFQSGWRQCFTPGGTQPRVLRRLGPGYPVNDDLREEVYHGGVIHMGLFAGGLFNLQFRRGFLTQPQVIRLGSPPMRRYATVLDGLSRALGGGLIAVGIIGLVHSFYILRREVVEAERSVVSASQNANSVGGKAASSGQSAASSAKDASSSARSSGDIGKTAVPMVFGVAQALSIYVNSWAWPVNFTVFVAWVSFLPAIDIGVVFPNIPQLAVLVVTLVLAMGIVGIVALIVQYDVAAYQTGPIASYDAARRNKVATEDADGNGDKNDEADSEDDEEPDASGRTSRERKEGVVPVPGTYPAPVMDVEFVSASRGGVFTIASSSLNDVEAGVRMVMAYQQQTPPMLISATRPGTKEVSVISGSFAPAEKEGGGSSVMFMLNADEGESGGAVSMAIRVKPQRVSFCPRHSRRLIEAIAKIHGSRYKHYQCAYAGRGWFTTCESEVRVCPKLSEEDARQTKFWVCPTDGCGYCLCTNIVCASSAIGIVDKMKAAVARRLYLVAREGWLPFFGLIAILLYQIVAMPVTRNSLLVMTCAPLYQCEFGDCYTRPTTTFLLAFVTSLLVLLFLLGFIPLYLTLTVAARRRAILHWAFNHGRDRYAEGRLEQKDITKAMWKDYLTFDESMLKPLYEQYEFGFMTWHMAFLIGKLLIVIPAVVFEANTYRQLSVTAGIEFVMYLVFAGLNPFLNYWVDMLARGGGLHQVFQLGWSALNRVAIYNDPDNHTYSYLMIATSCFYLILLVVIMVVTVVVPYLEERKAKKAARSLLATADAAKGAVKGADQEGVEIGNDPVVAVVEKDGIQPEEDDTGSMSSLDFREELHLVDKTTPA